MKLVYIKWKDSTSMRGGEWHDRQEIEEMKPLTVVNVGWVVRETKKFITIASGFTEHHVCGDICIPRACIKQIKELSGP